jgi:hypothetical protein
MKKLLLGVALALAASAAPAQGQVTSQPQAQDPDSVRAYWTEERMRTARPRENARSGEPKSQGGKPGGGGTTTSWSTLQVNWMTADPILKAHGKVFFTDGPYNYVCSGTAVDAHVVWTAGHCVYENGANRSYTNWAFVPAYNSGGSNAKIPATRLYTTTDWATKAGAYGRDLGAAYIPSTLSPTRTLNTAGALPLNTRVHSYGYPAEGKYSGANMYDCDTYISRRDTSTDPDDYGIPCGMNGGSSGGGWVYGGQVVSVNSYGYSSLKNTMFGPVQDSVAATLLNSAKTGT